MRKRDTEKGLVSVLPEYPLDKIIILTQTPQDIVHSKYMPTLPNDISR